MSTYYLNLDDHFRYSENLTTEEMIAEVKDGLMSIHWNVLDARKFYGYTYLEIEIFDYFSYGDYNGSLIEKSNIESFLEDLPEQDQKYVVEIYGNSSKTLGFIK